MQQQTSSRESSSIEALISPYPGFSATEVRPAYLNPQNNIWQVFRYKEVQRVLSDYQVFSTADERAFPNAGDPMNASLLHTAPARHTLLRKAVSQAFNTRIAHIEQNIHKIVEDLLLPLKGRGEMDLVNDFARPWPATFIAELLGAPAEDHLQLQGLAANYMKSIMAPSSAQAVSNLANYFLQLIEDHRLHPRDDLLSDLIAAEVDGERLTTQELLGNCFFFIIAGQSPGPLLINVILAFDAFPHIQPILRINPELIPGALEEVIRLVTPVVAAVPRITLQETVIDEQVIPEGSLVLPWMSAANRDPGQFVNPLIFDMQRYPNRHLTFSLGTHYCLGAPLARLEVKIAIGLLLQHLQDIAIDHSKPLARHQSPLLFTLEQVSITFKG